MFRSLPLRLSRSLTALALAGAVMLTAALPVAATDLGRPTTGDPALITILPLEQALLALTNADRVANGLEPLEFDPEMLDVARSRAASQLGTTSLTHYDSDGELAFVRLLVAAAVDYQLAGENLARASVGDVQVTDRVEQALMASPTHRKNILEQGFSRVAIGAASDGEGQVSFAEVYRN